MIKVSQAVSSEIVVEKLIDTLMRMAIEQAGAERGLLILARGAELRDRGGGHDRRRRGDRRICAASPYPKTRCRSRCSIMFNAPRESVILDDAAAHSPFADDPYIRRRQSPFSSLPAVAQSGQARRAFSTSRTTSPRAFLRRPGSRS